jgi:hypothetical protein
MILMKTLAPREQSGCFPVNFCSFFSANSERLEFRIFRELLRMVPGIEGRLMESSEEEVITMGELVMTCSIISAACD